MPTFTAPSIPKMFGVENERPFVEEIDGRQLMQPIERYGVKLLSIGFVDAATPWCNAAVWPSFVP